MSTNTGERGIATTVYAERTPEDLAGGRPLNLVSRLEQTRARERELGVAHWNEPAYGMFAAKVSVRVEPPLEFYGRMEPPGESIDFRIYLPRLMADYAERGGMIEYLTPTPESVIRLSARHELVVVASGRRSVAELFPRDPARSPFEAPQRVLTAGFFHGIAPMPEPAMQYQFCPGGRRDLRLAVPAPRRVGARDHHRGGPRRPAVRRGGPDLRLLRRGPGRLQPGRAQDVRRVRARAARADRRARVRPGPPVTGQGANLGSRCAFALAEEILAGPPFDETSPPLRN